MFCKMDLDFKKRTGLSKNDLKMGKLVEYEDDSKTFNFFPAKQIGDNFVNLITDSKSALNKDDIIKIVKEYTNHVTWYCTKINLLLAADSPEIKIHVDYIKKLRCCIRKLALSNPVTNIKCYRGMSCSQKEIEHYKVGCILYIPSFLSTSKNINKLYTCDKQNTVMVINLSTIPKNAISVTEEFSDFAKEEEEALFSCYSKFKVLSFEENKEFNNKLFKYYIELELIEDYEGLKMYEF